jgi:hypothetical protein
VSHESGEMWEKVVVVYCRIACKKSSPVTDRNHGIHFSIADPQSGFKPSRKKVLNM